MNKSLLSKTINYSLIALILLFITSIVLLVNGLFIHSRIPLVVVLYIATPFILAVLIIAALTAKTIRTHRTNFTRWVCVAIGVISLAAINVVYIFIPELKNEVGKIGLIATQIFGVALIILPLAIKNTYWTKWLLVYYLFSAFTAVIGAFAVFIEEMDSIKVEKYVVKYNVDNPSDYIATFSTYGSANSNINYRVKRYGFVKKYHRYEESELLGRWRSVQNSAVDEELGYDYDEEIDSYVLTYDSEIEIETDTIIEILGYNHFLQAIDNFEPGQTFLLTSSISLQENLVIEGVNHLKMISNLDQEGGSCFASSSSTITFKNCTNIILENISFLFEAEEPIMQGVSFVNCKNVCITKSSFRGNCNYLLCFDEKSSIGVIGENYFYDFLEYGVSFHINQFQNIEFNHFLRNNSYAYYFGYKIADVSLPASFNATFTGESLNYLKEYLFNYNSSSSSESEEDFPGEYTGNLQDAYDGFGISNILNEELPVVIEARYIPSYSVLRAISGFAPVIPNINDDVSYGFCKLNPLFIDWMAKYIKPGLFEAWFYNRSLKRVSRITVESYLYLNKSEDFRTLLGEYLFEGNDGEGLSFLNKRYKDALAHYIIADDDYCHEAFTCPADVSYFMGFWLRRMIDGSSESIWNACEKFMNIYDKEWFDEVKEQYM